MRHVTRSGAVTAKVVTDHAQPATKRLVIEAAEARPADRRSQTSVGEEGVALATHGVDHSLALDIVASWTRVTAALFAVRRATRTVVAGTADERGRAKVDAGALSER